MYVALLSGFLLSLCLIQAYSQSDSLLSADGTVLSPLSEIGSPLYLADLVDLTVSIHVCTRILASHKKFTITQSSEKTQTALTPDIPNYTSPHDSDNYGMMPYGTPLDFSSSNSNQTMSPNPQPSSSSSDSTPEPVSPRPPSSSSSESSPEPVTTRQPSSSSSAVLFPCNSTEQNTQPTLDETV